MGVGLFSVSSLFPLNKFKSTEKLKQEYATNTHFSSPKSTNCERYATFAFSPPSMCACLYVMHVHMCGFLLLLNHLDYVTDIMKPSLNSPAKISPKHHSHPYSDDAIMTQKNVVVYHNII